METEGSSVFEELAKAKAKKLEENEGRLDEATGGIADMVEGNMALQDRARESRETRFAWDTIFQSDMVSLAEERTALLNRAEQLKTKTIPGMQKQLQELQQLFADNPAEIENLVQRATQEIQTLKDELALMPEEERKILGASDRRQALETEIQDAYEKVEKNNIGFAVETTLGQMDLAGTPVGIKKEELTRAVAGELFHRRTERRKEEAERKDNERIEQETAWLHNLERTLAEAEAHIEKAVEEKGKFLRGETPDGQKFIADVNAKRGEMDSLLRKWTFRDKTKTNNETRARTLADDVHTMFEEQNETLRVLYNETQKALTEIMVSRTPDNSEDLRDYPYQYNYLYQSKERGEAIGQRVRNIHDRIHELRGNMDRQVNALRPLLEQIRTPE